MSIDAMKQALAALETVTVDVKTTPNAYEASRQAIIALRAAIEQEQGLIDSAEKAGAYMDARLREFIDMAAAWPEASPAPRTWGYVMVYAPRMARLKEKNI